MVTPFEISFTKYVIIDNNFYLIFVDGYLYFWAAPIVWNLQCKYNIALPELLHIRKWYITYKDEAIITNKQQFANTRST